MRDTSQLSWLEVRLPAEELSLTGAQDDSGDISVDFIGRFESLDDDWRLLCDVIGVKLSLPHEMVGPVDVSELRGRYRDYYDEETRRLVARRYERDIDAFGYEF